MSEKKTVKIQSLNRVMSIAPGSIDLENRTVEVVWTTGARARQWSWELGEITEELEVSSKAINMERLGSGSAPFLNMHDGWSLSSILGVVERAWIVDGKEGRAVIRFPKGDEDIDKIWNLVAQRIICNISVGYTVEEYEKYEENGEIIYRAIKWTPVELSAVTVPADANANVRSKEVRTNACVITTRSTTKEKIMTKRSKREDEEDIEKIDIEEEARSDDQDPEKDDTPAEEDREDEEDKENREDCDDDKECRSSKFSISRRDFIYDLCEVAGLPISAARKFNESKLPLSSIRSQILKQRSADFENVSNTRGISTSKKTKTLAQRAAEVYKK